MEGLDTTRIACLKGLTSSKLAGVDTVARSVCGGAEMDFCTKDWIDTPVLVFAGEGVYNTQRLERSASRSMILLARYRDRCGLLHVTCIT